MIKLRIILISLVAPLVIFQCNSDHPVPEVYVNFIMELNNPTFIDLNTPGNSFFYENEGYHGIIVTNVGVGSSFNNEPFRAYEATCTYDPDNSNSIIDIVDLMFGECRNCGSRFSLMIDGFVEKGPAGLPLKTYSTSYNQIANTLHIHN